MQVQVLSRAPNMQKCCNGRQCWLRTSSLRVRISSSAPCSVGATVDATSSNLVSLRVRISDGVPNALMLELVYIKDLKSLAHAGLRVRTPLGAPNAHIALVVEVSPCKRGMAVRFDLWAPNYLFLSCVL